ncbi:MAG TPA: CoA pyrophosphatase [Streptosporangiaceae bacterium]|nr:CoA pyrophosphatase [Streptosporangiaceae bacterium]
MSPASAAIRRSAMTANVAAFRRITLHRPDLRPASVAVCVLTGPEGDTMLITRRASTLRNHAGQWALPGGRRDPGESAEAAALRELAEETGVQVGPDAVLGLLDDYVTRSGYLITPTVIWGGESPGSLAGPPGEVSRIYQVPLADLDVEPETVTIPESDAPVIRLPLLGRYVHAPTAAIIYQFCQVALHGAEQRVSHFDAPVFAWR